MRLHRFFVSKEIDKKKEIVVRDSSLYNQLRNVFRFNIGGQVILLDNTGYEYHALISSFERGDLMFSIVSRKESKNIPNRELYLFCSLTKKDKFEWIIEKGTELGVSKFFPIISDRSEKKEINFDRARVILKEAAEQSEKALIPEITEIKHFEHSLSHEFPCFAFHTKGEEFRIEHIHNLSPIGVFIGPEGGWSEKELFLFNKNSVKIYSLGNVVFKSETAAIAVSSLILLQ